MSLEALRGPVAGTVSEQPSVQPVAGIWIQYKNLHAALTIEFLRFTAQRLVYRARCMPTRGPAASMLAGVEVFVGALVLAIAFLRRTCRLYWVVDETPVAPVPVAPVKDARLRYHWRFDGKRHSHYLGTYASDARHWIYKVAQSRPQFAAEIDARRELGRYFRIAPYEIDRERLTFRECYVQGTSLLEATPAEQIAAVQQLIAIQTRLVAASRVGPVVSGTSVVAKLARHPALRGSETGPGRSAHAVLCLSLMHRDAAYRRVFGHNDLTGTNVIIASDRTPVLIDFERAALTVYFADILWLIVDLAIRGRHVCLDALGDGVFDAALASLWRAAGNRYDCRQLSAYAGIAVCAKTANDMDILDANCWSARTFIKRLRVANRLRARHSAQIAGDVS
jgi:hypothetical protein